MIDCVVLLIVLGMCRLWWFVCYGFDLRYGCYACVGCFVVLPIFRVAYVYLLLLSV